MTIWPYRNLYSNRWLEILLLWETMVNFQHCGSLELHAWFMITFSYETMWIAVVVFLRCLLYAFSHIANMNTGWQRNWTPMWCHIKATIILRIWNRDWIAGVPGHSANIPKTSLQRTGSPLCWPTALDRSGRNFGQFLHRAKNTQDKIGYHLLREITQGRSEIPN